MKKNKLAILISCLIIVFLFSFAAVCNQCSAITPASEGEEEREQVRTSSTQSASASSQEDADESSSADSRNDPPVIDEVNLTSPDGSVSLDLFNAEIQENYLMNWPADAGPNRFVVMASDEDGDELEYFVGDDSGNNFEINRLSNNEAEFFWGSSELGPVTLTVRVTDGKGGEAAYDIEINIIVYEEDIADFIPEEEDGEGEVGLSEGARSIVPSASMSGHIVKDREVIVASSSAGAPYILVGDNDSRQQVKGYLSFDISELHGKSVLDAEIDFTRLERLNNPGFATSLDVKADDFGSLDLSDFAPGGVTLANIPTGSSSYVIRNEALVSELQRVLDDPALNYFQIRLGLSSSTNDDTTVDGFTIYLGETALVVSYSG